MNRKVLILGGPKTGKSTRAQGMGTPVLNTDHLRDRGWGEDSAEVAQWMNKPGSWGHFTCQKARDWKEHDPGRSRRTGGQGSRHDRKFFENS